MGRQEEPQEKVRSPKPFQEGGIARQVHGFLKWAL